MSRGLDGRLLGALRRDGRADVATIADAVDASVPTVRERIRALEADGTIRGYSARLDHDELGHVTAILRLRVDRAAVAAVVERLESLPWVVALYETTGPEQMVIVARVAEDATLGARVTALHLDPDIDGVTADRVDRIVCERAGPALAD